MRSLAPCCDKLVSQSNCQGMICLPRHLAHIILDNSWEVAISQLRDVASVSMLRD